MTAQRFAGCSLGLLLLATQAYATPKDSCAPGLRRGLHGCVSGAPSVPRQEPSAAHKDSGPPAPDVHMRPPPEKSAAQAASRQLLMAELAQLEALLKATAKGSPERAAIVRRLAEGYVELEHLADHDRIAADLRAEQATRAEQLERKAAPTRPKTPVVL